MKLTITTFIACLLFTPTINAFCCYYGGPNCIPREKERRYYALEGWVPEDAINVDKREALEAVSRCCCFAARPGLCESQCVSCESAPETLYILTITYIVPLRAF
jgi:hypothetical protein